MSKHKFVLTPKSESFNEFQRLIYCEWCGLVVWNFNANEHTKPSRAEYQAKTGKPCLAMTTNYQQKENRNGNSSNRWRDSDWHGRRD